MPRLAELTEWTPGTLTLGEALPLDMGEPLGGLSPHMAISLEFIQGATIQMSLSKSHEPLEGKKSPPTGSRRGAQTQAGRGGPGLPLLLWETGAG